MIASKAPKTLSELHKQLYLACRTAIDVQFKNDIEAVKQLRDGTTKYLLNKNYKDLNEQELEFCIRYVENSENYATPAELRKFYFYAFKLGLHYSTFESVSIIDTRDGKKYTGLHCKSRMIFYNENNIYLPRKILTYLFDNWINPKVREILKNKFDKTFRTNLLHYEELEKEQVKHLINVFRKMWKEVDNKQVPTMNMN